MRGHDVEEETLGYRPVVDTCPIDVTKDHVFYVAHGSVLTLPECHTQDDEITVRIYRLQIFQLIVGCRPTVRKEIHIIELDYPLDYHAQTLLQISPDFIEPIVDDVPIDKERQIRDSDIRSEKQEVLDQDLGQKAYGIEINDDMDEAYSWSATPPHYLVTSASTEDSAIF